MPTNESLLRAQFLDYVYQDRRGYACLATLNTVNGKKDTFYQEFFKWPEEKDAASKFIDGARSKNVFFSVNLFDEQKRKSENCLPGNLVWADLDSFNPNDLEPTPTVIVESSTDRFQALWRLDEVLPPGITEEYSKRVYNKHKLNGVDSGWSRTKLLRVPFTKNFKYSSTPNVKLLRVEEEAVNSSVFESMVMDHLVETTGEDAEFPDLVNLPSVESVLYAHRFELKKNSSFITLYTEEPQDDWSSALWNLIKICFEAGLSREETFLVASAAKCNKYERDKRPITHLWADVVKADITAQTFSLLLGDDEEDIAFPEIINDDERKLIEPTFINDYVKWASSVTDANVVYHELCGTILLSILLADKLHLNVSWGKVIPNLWGLVLGESTLTRKTTAMDMAMEFVLEFEPELIISAQDSSAEGLLSALSQRPEKVSVYYRDEVAGFFDGMANKSYLAGMPEVLTKLYDVPAYLPRQLRKETIVVIKPVFVFFGGGIQDRVYETVNEDFFYSGFLPRFLVVNGESDMDNLRWIGPAKKTEEGVSPREDIKTKLQNLVSNYKVQIVTTKILGQEAETSKEVEAILTPKAWEKMREIEKVLVSTANASGISLIALPTFTRMSTSLLKMAILFAASRQEPRDFEIKVELKDVLQAAYYITRWSPYTIHMMQNVGQSTSERTIQKVLRSIRSNPGIPRSECMRRHHLQSLPAKQIFATLEERGLITLRQEGRGTRLWPV